MKTIKTTFLKNDKAGSDKVFNVFLLQDGAGWLVFTKNGRRGGTLTDRTRTPKPVDEAEARKIFDATVKEKRSGGYDLIEGDGSAQIGNAVATEKKDSGIYLQLLNEITHEQALALCRNDEWGLQIKHDGERQAIKRRVNEGAATAINRKGQEIPADISIAHDIEKLGRGLTSILVDGENVGDLWAFDLLEADLVDLRAFFYVERYKSLKKLFDKNPGLNHVHLVPLYTTTKEKLAAYAKAEADHAEGVVFKRLNSVYTAGRPNKGGDQLKRKFWKDVDVILGERLAKAGPRSMTMWLHTKLEAIFMGSVKIHDNYPMPKPGDVAKIRFLYAYPNGGKLFEPQFEGVRTDKHKSECTYDQLNGKFRQGTERKDDDA